VAAALMTPLTPADGVARKTKNGALMSKEAALFIKPNDRLTSLERLEIYSKSYWFRLIDSLYDDFPGLAAILGWSAFERLAKAYLFECPSRSFTLRDLGSQLEPWLRENPQYAGSNPTLALDMVRLEWAHIQAFDGTEQKVLGPEDLVILSPSLRVGLQPYVSLLDLAYPVDKLRVKICADQEGSNTASNAALKKKHRAIHKVSKALPESIFVAVHRFNLVVYYRRLNPEELRLLQALRSGKSVAASIRLAFHGSSLNREEIPPLLKTWFAIWAELGWLTVRPTKKGYTRNESKS
jgi:hypothetical protein